MYYGKETDSKEDFENVIGKKTKGKTSIVSITKGKKTDRGMSIPSYDEPLIQRMYRGKKINS